MAVVDQGDGNELRPRSRAEVKRRLLKMFADTAGSMADELIAERRSEAEREASRGLHDRLLNSPPE